MYVQQKRIFATKHQYNFYAIIPWRCMKHFKFVDKY